MENKRGQGGCEDEKRGEKTGKEREKKMAEREGEGRRGKEREGED